MMNEATSNEAENAIGVVMSNGQIERICVNNAALENLSVVVIDGDNGHKLMRADLDEAVTGHLKSAREKNAKAGIALVAELAGAQLMETSTASYASSQEMAQALAQTLEQAAFLLGKARSGDLPAEEMQTAVPASEADAGAEPTDVEQSDDDAEAALTEAAAAMNEAAAVMQEAAPHAAETTEHDDSEADSAQGAAVPLHARLAPIWK